jgi:hypothetical protein
MRAVRILRPLATFAIVAGAACAVAPAAGNRGGLVAPGVHVGWTYVSGFTSEPARLLLRREFERPLVFELRGRRWEADPVRLGARADVDAAVRSALRAAEGERLGLPVSIQRERIRSYVAALAYSFKAPPREARLDGLDERLRPILLPARAGYRIDQHAFERELVAALRWNTRVPIRVPVFSVEPRRAIRTVIVIRRETKRLDLFAGKRLVRRFRIATGTWQYPTPLGEFALVEKQRNPAWYPPPSDWARGLSPVPPGPGNPLGTRWMGLSAPSVGIHGTPDAASVGYSASHGCIRMYVPDAEWLFERVQVGTPVFIVSA